MMKYGMRWATVLVALIVLGCAATRLDSSRSPEFAQKTFRKWLVMVPVADLKMQADAEDAFVVKFREAGAEALPSSAILVPEQKYTEKAMEELLGRYGVDGVLLVTLTGSYDQRIDIFSSAGCSSAMVTANAALLDSRSCDLGSYAMRPTMEFKMRLYEVATNQTAWEATSFTQGATLTEPRRLLDSLAEKAVKDLKLMGFLP
jgi:hypothetical protein